MTHLNRLEKNGSAYLYTDRDGDEIEIDASSNERELIIHVKGSGRTTSAFLHIEDLDAFIAALRDAATPTCDACDGTGKRL